MFRPTGLFRNIACPQRSTCKLQNCFFSHQAVEPPARALSAAIVTGISNTTPAENEHSPTPPPPKRRRIDDPEPSKSAEVASNHAKPPLRSILKKANEGPSAPSSSSSTSTTPSSAPNKNTQFTTSKATTSSTLAHKSDASFDSENGRYIPVETTDNKTGMKSRTRIERGGSINLLSRAESSTPSRAVSQPLRGLHTTPTQKNTLATKSDVTGELLSWGTKSTPSKPPEPERLVPREVRKAPAQFEVRMNLLKVLHDEYIRLDPSSQETVLGKQRAMKLARDEEEAAATGDNKAYAVILKNRIFALKKMKPEDFKKEIQEKLKAQDPQKGDLNTTLEAEGEVRALEAYVHRPAVLKLFDYVLVAPSDADVAKATDGVIAAGGEEACERCQSRFRVLGTKDEAGLLTTAGKCTHHWGKAWVTEKGGQKVWQCCQTPVGESQGCTTLSEHVFNVKSAPRLASVFQFAETPAPVESADKKAEKAICLDCEMAYTTKGLEMIRLTATRFPTYETVLDVLVKPFGEVLDLNTRFSGVAPEQWATAPAYDPESASQPGDVLAVVSSPLAARETLFKYIDSSTIMIGHALDNDLKTTRMIHEKVVDTCILYTHPKGMPFRYSLKYLVQKYLGRFIQSIDSDKGHDSKEDANESGNLVRYKIAQDVKKGKIGKDGRWVDAEENKEPVKPAK